MIEITYPNGMVRSLDALSDAPLRYDFLASLMTESEMTSFFQGTELRSIAARICPGKFKTEAAAAKAIYRHFHGSA